MVHLRSDINVGRTARERIIRMRTLARKAAHLSPQLARDYIVLMENIALRFDITLPPDIKRSYCKKCKTPYSAETRIRLRNGMNIVRCANCGDLRRIPY